jgi:hypothetical protein|nr:MAG TPA: Minor capsid protein from bacteriophage [Caudoviricetes sp.]
MADIKGKMEIIKEFIEKCPLLKGGKVNVDYLKSKTYSYSIDETPTTTIIQRFADGGCREQINFDFSIQAPFNALETINNSKFCDDFIQWIKEQEKKNNLPDIDGIEKISCNRGTILQTTETTAIYVIPMQIIYIEEY